MLRRALSRCLLLEQCTARLSGLSARRQQSDSDSLYETPNVKQLPVQVRERLHKAEDVHGFIPNFLHMYSRRPKEFSAFFEYHDTLMSEERGNLTRMEKEMIALVTSAKQGCVYCAVAHSGLLKKNSDDAIHPEELIINWHHANITDRQKAILSFANRISHGKPASKDDFEKLMAHGLDSEDAWDIVAVMGLTTMTSYMAILTDVQPNDQFYKMSKRK